jgi:hypothetical protein
MQITNLQLTDKQAIAWYETATPEVKAILEETYKNRGGKRFFIQDITKQIKTFDDILNFVQLDEDEKFLLNYNGTNKNILSCKYHLKIELIVQVLNNGVECDIMNTTECKYYPWFVVGSSGFSFFNFYYQFSFTLVAGRLCFKTEDLAVFAGQTFELEYNDYLSC